MSGILDQQTDPTPDRRVDIVCSTCPQDSEPLASAKWHTTAPFYTFTIDMRADGLVVTYNGAENSYLVKCERDCPSRSGVTMTKTQWLERCASVWGGGLTRMIQIP